MNCRLLLAVLTLIIGAGVGDSGASAQSTRIREVMKEKLEHSQEILSAVATSNWVNLERHSLELLRLAKDPAWSALTTPEYARYSSAFLEAAEDLAEAARQRDLEIAPVAYVSLTLSCIQCHRYVGRSRVARIPHGSLDP
jgi:hypothetical protein